MSTATFVKYADSFSGNAALFKLDPPVKVQKYHNADVYVTIQHTYVIASAVHVYGVPETYLFAADSAGRVVDWSELPGSSRGTHSHTDVLGFAGYEVE